MEANKKLNASLDAVFNSAEYNELHHVVIELRDNGGVELHPDTARNIDVLAHVTGWIYDQLQPVKRGKTKTQKIRQALGYLIP